MRVTYPMAEATPPDTGEETKLHRTVSNDGTEIGYWTSGEGPLLVLVNGPFGDHTRWGTLHAIPPVGGDDKSYTTHLSGFSPEASSSRRHHPRGQWIPSPSSPAWRQCPSGPRHELENGGF